jgi:threonine dehydrogenase-like Zn-dependent dehydrogenase
VGVPAQDVTIPLPLIQDHQIRIQGSATYLPADYAEAIELLQSGAVRAADIVTNTQPLTDVAAAFERSQSGHDIKVLVVIDTEAFNA